MNDKRETALSRWSRLKRADRERQPLPPAEDRLPDIADTPGANIEDIPPDEPRDEADGDGSDAAPPPDLPDIAELNAESDFTAFLREGVSEDLRRRALRVLWRSDPVLANLDGLNDYDEDFRSAGVIGAAARTAYKAARGYLQNDEGPLPEGDAIAPNESPPFADGATASPTTDADPEKKSG